MMITRDNHFRDQIVAGVLHLRPADTLPATTWAHRELQVAAAANHNAIAADLQSARTERGALSHQHFADWEAEP